MLKINNITYLITNSSDVIEEMFSNSYKFDGFTIYSNDAKFFTLKDSSFLVFTSHEFNKQDFFEDESFLINNDIIYIEITNKNKIILFFGSTGRNSCYYYNYNNVVLITNQAKNFKAVQDIHLELLPLNNYQYNFLYEFDKTYTLFNHTKKLVAGYVYIFNDLLQLTSQIEKSPIQENTIPNIRHDEATNYIYNNLLNNVKQNSNSQKIVVPLSGGLDSLIIARLLQFTNAEIMAYTIGTDYGNEFDAANISAKHLGITHNCYTMTVDDIPLHFFNAIYYNEIADPVFAEGFTIFSKLFSLVQGQTQQVFTGYGADLILGDFLKTKNRAQINKECAFWCTRAGWTGELNHELAHHYDLQLYHPFFEKNLINYCLSIPFEMKYLNEETKAILRTMAIQKNLLPHHLAWNKKTPLNTGAAIDQLFNQYLNIKQDINYSIKSIFHYLTFEAIFIHNLEYHEIDFNYIINKTKQHEH